MAPPGGFDLFAIYRDHSKQEEMTDFSFEFRPNQCRFRVNKDTMIKASMDGELILRETDNVFPQLKNYCATARFGEAIYSGDPDSLGEQLGRNKNEI